MISKKKLLFKLIIAFLIPVVVSAQDGGPEDYDEDAPKHSMKGWHAGLYLGAYWPGKLSASLYDGYGFDFEENKNTWENSWMNQKINIQYAGLNGQPDYIGEALGVQYGQWHFNEDDMPTNMIYNTAFSVGFNSRYSIDEQNVIVFNVNAAIIKATGNFTIVLDAVPNSTQINQQIKTFNISGEEQRLLFQLGYQRIFGKGDGMHLFMEGGLHATLAQFAKNEIQIENLVINLVQDYYDSNTGYTFYINNKPSGLGFGAFGGVGVHFETSSKWNLQLVYSPLLENIRIGYDQKLSFSQMVGLRAYYMLSKAK